MFEVKKRIVMYVVSIYELDVSISVLTWIEDQLYVIINCDAIVSD